MANTVQDNNRMAWRYTDNNSQQWRVSAKTVYVTHGVDAAKYGGAAAASSMQAKPASLKMRSVECTSGATTIRVPCYDTACALWTTPGTTLTRNLNGVDATFTSTAVKHEEKNAKQAKQAS